MPVTGRGELGREILASVSRSFYLTIRLLPLRLRDPVGLAYLLARASDTIADSAEVPVERRTRALAEFARVVAAPEEVSVDLREITPTNPAEARLLVRVPDCLAWLQALHPEDRADVQEVLAKIVRGQQRDLVRFQESDRLVDEEELAEYTYLVAGCVGEFWTKISMRHLARYSQLPLEMMLKLGREFGQGLQLVNILRDVPEDVRNGRCYLPKPGAEEFGQWHARAVSQVDLGFQYLAAVRPWRLRLALILPWYLAMRTLELVPTLSAVENGPRRKVSRREVRTLLLIAPLLALGNGPLRWVRGRLMARVSR